MEAAVLAAFSTADTTIKDKEEKIKDHTIKHTHIPYDNDISETCFYHFSFLAINCEQKLLEEQNVDDFKGLLCNAIHLYLLLPPF